MSDLSANLSLPYLLPAQAQKHVTHNEALRLLDALVQLSVTSRSDTAPPPVPVEGQRYLMGAGVTGAWAGQAGMVAIYEEAAWVFVAPRAGWRAWVEDEEELVVHDGTDWALLSDYIDLQNIAMLGVQTTADETNRLAVAGDAVLLTHAGGGHQLKINKATPGETASLLFQTGWSGRAEMGTAGTDDFSVKVSADGSAFHTALTCDGATGEVSFPSGATGVVTPALLTARMGLVANGAGHAGDASNMPGELAFDPARAPGLPGSFVFEGHYPGVIAAQELAAVDPNRVYRLSAWFRQEGLAGDFTAYGEEERHQQNAGLLCHDADGLLIEGRHHRRYRHSGTDSLTVLAAPLSPGDMSISLVSAAGWNELSAASADLGVIVFGYASAGGQVHDRYSRLVEHGLFDLGDVNKTTHVVTLNQPFPVALGNPDDGGGTWPAGTAIANTAASGAQKPVLLDEEYLPATETWYRAVHHVGGIDRSGQDITRNFAPGTAYVRPYWEPNLSNRAGGHAGHPDTGAAHRLWIAGVTLEVEPLALTQEDAAGARDLMVPVADWGAGTLDLAAPGLSLSAL